MSAFVRKPLTTHDYYDTIEIVDYVIYIIVPMRVESLSRRGDRGGVRSLGYTEEK